jgi:hypothetical protein
MTYAMPSVLGYSITPSEWAELNRLRMARMHGERRKRAGELSRSKYALLGTDHPALLVREVAHGMTMARCESSRTSLAVVEWLKPKGQRVQTDTAISRAERDLAEAKAWCGLYCLLMVAAARVVRRISSALDSLIARLAGIVSTPLPDTKRERAPQVIALACHLAAQAPPSFNVTAYRGGILPKQPHRQERW